MKIMTTDPEDAGAERPSPACSSNGTGALPSCAPLAVPYVPFQGQDPQRYEGIDALSAGTLFPGLNLPFRLKPEATTVVSTPLAELQALGFVLHELSLYLDTHPEDQEAFALYQTYANLLIQGRKTYVAKYGPLTHLEAAQEANYTWLKDPWPWEGGMA